MDKRQKFLSSAFLLGSALVITPLTQAAYPKNMAVTIEMWNNTDADLQLASATWLAPDTDLAGYVMPASFRNASFGITLKNPRNDSATYRMKDGVRVCEFTFGHEAKFEWWSINPAPEKFARARSVGQVPVECKGSVIKGTNSMSGYTVRFVMKHITR